MKNAVKKQLNKIPNIKLFYGGVNCLKEKLAKINQRNLESKNPHDKIRALKRRNKEVENELKQYKTWVPPGHFYSPNPDLKEVRAKEKDIYGSIPREIEGIDLRFEEQKKLLGELQKFYSEVPFKDLKSGSLRYFFENPAYSYADAIFLYSMVRHLRPKKIIEVGSGYSSCVMLDTNELFLENKISLSFVEPYPELLYSLMRKGDKENVEIISKNIQDIDESKFSSLEAGDILFIDSTHVSKINSDVNYIFFNLLPALKSGVYIHFHDIFYPFEYPKSWIYEGRAWNEDYMMRAFLQYNNDFEIVYFIDYMQQFFGEEISKSMPLASMNRGGGIWLKKK